MKKQTLKFIIPLTVISFVLLQKWWYVLVVDGTKEIMYGFPLIYTCKEFHTSMSYQFFIFEFLVDILVFFTFWVLIFYFLKNLKFLFRYQKTISIVLYVFTSILLCYETLIISNPNNLFKIKRNFEIENIESGFKFLWQNNISDTSTKSSSKNLTFEEQPAKTVIDFLKWYRMKQEKLQYNLVDHNGGKEEANYVVNFKETENYLATLKSTQFISDKYINSRREYFKKCDLDFKNNPQKEGPAVGFDYDFIMLSQDSEDDLKDCEKSTIIEQEIQKDEAKIKVSFPYGNILTYKLSKQDDKWLIDAIDRD